MLDFSVLLQGFKACKLRKDGRREGVVVGKREIEQGERETDRDRETGSEWKPEEDRERGGEERQTGGGGGGEREKEKQRERKKGEGVVSGEKETGESRSALTSPHLTCAPSVRWPDDQTRPLTEGRNAVSKRSLKAHVHSRSPLTATRSSPPSAALRGLDSTAVVVL